jgi:outer membrane protein TolC
VISISIRSIFFVGSLLLIPLAAGAQPAARGPLPLGSPFLGGVPTGVATRDPLQLSLQDAVLRALDHNLAAIAAEERSASASGARTHAFADLLPNLTASVSESRRTTNLEAFGFPLREDFPRVVGPFNVFDARLFVSQAIIDRRAANDARAAEHELTATRHEYRDARELVVLVAGNLYLQAVIANARAESARAQRDTADALHRQAQNLRQNGLVAGIDVVRAEVRLSTERQRATAAENEFQKAKLQLARAIGLPPGQPFVLTDTVPYSPAPVITLDVALERAYRERPDYLAALERVQAAEAARRSVAGELLPSVRLSADYGAIGLTAATSLPTFSVAGIVDVPLFEGGRVRGRIAQADSELRMRRAEAEDARAGIYYEVQTAFLDLQASEEELKTATRARELSDQQLTQSRDRFAAGVVSNIEVIQSQEAVALSSEQYIGALYRFNVAKTMLARAIGTIENAITTREAK